MLCIDAINYSHLHYVVHNRTHNILIPLETCPYVGSATVSFKEFVTLHRRTLQQIFGSRPSMAFFGYANSWPGMRIPQTKQLNYIRVIHLVQISKIKLGIMIHFSPIFVASPDRETGSRKCFLE